MNPFDFLIEDIFNCNDFVEFCYINNRKTKCISSEINTDSDYTAFGIDNGVSFFLRIKKDNYRPKKGDLITFKQMKYKVDTFTLDSAGKSYNIYLNSVTTK